MDKTEYQQRAQEAFECDDEEAWLDALYADVWDMLAHEEEVFMQSTEWVAAKDTTNTTTKP